MLNQQDQQPQSLVSTVWTKKAEIVEVLFLIGVLLIVLHIISLIALFYIFRRLSSVPSWIWTEPKVLVYPMTLTLWLRLLAIVPTHQLRPIQKKRYINIFLLSLAALVLALNFSVWYSNAAFPLLSITYTAWILDACLAPKPRRKQKARLASYLPVAKPPKKSFPVNLKQTAFSQHRPSNFFRRTHQIGYSTPARLPKKVGIWHHPADENFAKRLRTHLRSKIREDAIDLWDASQIQPGALWQDERAQATQSATVVLVLVSANLIACDSIMCDELPQLLRRAKTQGTVILVLHVRPCNFASSGLGRFQALNSPEKPLAKLGTSDRDMVLTRVTHIICQRLGVRS